MTTLYGGRPRRRNINTAHRLAEMSRWVRRYIAGGGCEWMTVEHMIRWQDEYGRSEGVNLHAPRCVAVRLTPRRPVCEVPA